MKDSIKIIFFDVDGTLIDMDTKVPTDITINALKKLRQSGYKICLATGRSPMSLPNLGDIEFDAYLTYNGSLCYANDIKIFSNPISKKDIINTLENARNLGKPVALATDNILSANGIDQDLIDYYGFAHQEVFIDPNFEDRINEEVYQIMMGARVSEYESILKGSENIKIAAWWHRAVDIIPKNGGKGAGVKAILKHFGYERNQAMAFGDGDNDIDLFQAVRVSVAMENASENLKEIAIDICGHVSENGVTRYLEKLLLI